MLWKLTWFESMIKNENLNVLFVERSSCIRKIILGSGIFPRPINPSLASGSTTSRTKKFEVEWSMIRHMKRHEENPDKIFRTQSVRNCYKKNNIKFWNKDWDLNISHHSKSFQNQEDFSSFDNQEDFLVEGCSLGNPYLHIQLYQIYTVTCLDRKSIA